VPVTTQPAIFTEVAVLAALRDCYYPALALNLVDLGAIHNIVLAPDPAAPGAGIAGVPQRCRVQIALTLPPQEDAADEAATAQLIAQVENRLAAFESVTRTNVTVLAEPAWTPDRISPEGRALLAVRAAELTKRDDGLVQIQIQIPTDARS
jgi:metal-sulfur cluster biosynthetic enzyme